MKRREFIALAGAAAWPVVGRAQQGAMPVIGYLGAQQPGDSSSFETSFRQGLAEMGFTEGRNVIFEYRWAEGRIDRLPILAAELARQNVAVIYANGAEDAALAAKAATSTIPVVFSTGTDPVAIGLVPSLNRPGGNVTGATFLASTLAPKQLGLLRDVAPSARKIGLLVTANPSTGAVIASVQSAAHATGLSLIVQSAVTRADLDLAFAAFAEQGIEALVTTSPPFFTLQSDYLVSLATNLAVPAIFASRTVVTAGGLMSYTARVSDTFRQAGVYTGRILRGDKPADLPVVLASRYEFIINLKTAKALDLVIPPALLAIADEVIE